MTGFTTLSTSAYYCIILATIWFITIWYFLYYTCFMTIALRHLLLLATICKKKWLFSLRWCNSSCCVMKLGWVRGIETNNYVCFLGGEWVIILLRWTSPLYEPLWNQYNSNDVRTVLLWVQNLQNCKICMIYPFKAPFKKLVARSSTKRHGRTLIFFCFHLSHNDEGLGAENIHIWNFEFFKTS